MNKNRLASLDALRGFDMFFIMGGAGLIAGICAALGCGDSWLAHQMNHVPWAGLAHHDTIFPLFMFLAGVTWPFSLASQRERGRTNGQIHRKLLFRSIGLFLLGLSFGGILAFRPTFRLSSVIGFIGLCWGIAALLFMHIEKPWKRAVVMGAIAVGYFSLLHFFAMPGAPADVDTYCQQWNIIRWFDINTYPMHLLVPAVEGAKCPYEPESLFSIPGGVLLIMLGMSAGSVLLSAKFAPMKKVGILFGSALAALIVTLFLVFVVKAQIVKALWTIPFVTAAATYAFAMLGLFYWIVDVKGWRKWTILFDPIGKNSILVYTLAMIGVTACVCKFLFGGITEASGVWKSAVAGLGSLLFTWSIARFCQRHDIYLKF